MTTLQPDQTPEQVKGTVDELRAKTRRDGDCLVWTGWTFPGKGYGRISVPTAEGRRYWRVHRYAFVRAWGAIPDGMVVDHKCHNRACWNPWHLQAVPYKLNSENRDPERYPQRGVYWNNGSWMVRVKHNYKSVYGGRFASKDEAVRAAADLRLRLFSNSLMDGAKG